MNTQAISKSESRTTKLKWFGTVVGDANQQEFVIAAPTRNRCLFAARQFFPEARSYDVQPVTLVSRQHD
jgi:hypothetical protein